MSWPNKRDSFIFEPITIPKPAHTPGSHNLVRRDHDIRSDSQRPERYIAMTKLSAKDITPQAPPALQRISNSVVASQEGIKWVGGIHQQTNVKLPGYWTHERATQLQELANTRKRECERNEGAGPVVENKPEGQSLCDGEVQVDGSENGRSDEGFWNVVARGKAWLLA
ncbi:hypothetical protein DE146DRAFT_259654 [Phaeosphaeria sp. MPI-PUGE-AT-0046c]|nr:hypothetical protein DE146DRAFT_259654 [Phaeosphaeria sp. MPI-PUGE-AT-0046c]